MKIERLHLERSSVKNEEEEELRVAPFSPLLLGNGPLAEEAGHHGGSQIQMTQQQCCYTNYQLMLEKSSRNGLHPARYIGTMLLVLVYIVLYFFFVCINKIVCHFLN